MTSTRHYTRSNTSADTAWASTVARTVARLAHLLHEKGANAVELRRSPAGLLTVREVGAKRKYGGATELVGTFNRAMPIGDLIEEVAAALPEKD